MFYKTGPDALPEQKGIERYFLVPYFSFACIGIDPTSLQRTYVSYFLAWIPMMTLLTLCFPIVIYASQYIRDLNLVTDALSPIWQSMLGILKLLYFMWNKKRIITLLRKLWLWNLQAKGEELQILVEENSRDTKFSIFFYACVFTTGVMALISPLVIAFFYHLRGEGFRNNLGPPLKAAYFSDLSTNSGYAIAYLWDLSGIYFVINGNLAIDSLFSWFMHNVSAQFRIVQLLIRKDANLIRHKGDDDKFCLLIKHRVQHHLRVINLAQNFNDVYMNILFIKFTISCIQIAFLAYQFGKGSELSAQLFHLFFLISVSLQLILYCYGGQRIKDESSAVAEAIYLQFKWHNLSVRAQKLLLLTLMRAQKSCTVTGVFFVADLSLYLWIFKTAGSFITMLLAMGEN